MKTKSIQDAEAQKIRELIKNPVSIENAIAVAKKEAKLWESVEYDNQDETGILFGSKEGAKNTQQQKPKN